MCAHEPQRLHIQSGSRVDILPKFSKLAQHFRAGKKDVVQTSNFFILLTNEQLAMHLVERHTHTNERCPGVFLIEADKR